MAATKFRIVTPPPPALTVAQTAAKYGLSKAAAEDVARYVAGREPVRRVRSRARKKIAARKAR
jgi:hypothetical protein